MKKITAIITIMLILSASAVFAGGSGEKDGKVVYPKGNFDFVAPGGAGGGWDLYNQDNSKSS